MTTPDSSYPHVRLPDPVRGGREPLDQARGRPVPRGQGRLAQAARLEPGFQALSTAMRNQTASISPSLQGTDPELVLVLEIVGNVEDFYAAVRRVEGLEFLAGIDEVGIDAGDYFEDEGHPDRLLDGTLFLLASNQGALTEVLRLWQRYKDRPADPWPRGFTGWRNVFDLLLDVRIWGPQDRLKGTGVLEDFAARAAAGVDTVRAEVEMWFRTDPVRRNASEVEVRTAVQTSNGNVVTKAEIPEIAYHALLVDLPIAEVESLLEQGPEAIALLRSEGVAFLRPEAQALVPLEPLEEPPGRTDVVASPGAGPGEPVVALLDGLPLVGHLLLDGRVDLDDPEQFDSMVPPEDRRHGTAMAGAVLHGDLNAPSTGPSRIHMRPVLLPVREWNGAVVERTPPNVLAIDLFHDAVRRMVDPSHPAGPTAPHVRIVNISIGDSGLQLASALSPWARLLDWLSYRYRILFVVSAGNHPRPLVIPTPWSTLSTLDSSDQRRHALSAMVKDAPYTRLLSPAEALNVVTVGATHDDETGVDQRGFLQDPLPKSAAGLDAAAAVYGARGGGYRRSVKPDILAPGGRMLYRRELSGPAEETRFTPDTRPSRLAPGVRLAAPGASGRLDGDFHWYGTSVSAALVTHHAGALAERLMASPYDVPQEFIGPLAKAITVHACSLGAGADELRAAWPALDAHRLKENIGRFYGYGVLQPARLLGGADERITLFGYGEVGAGEGLTYEVPLPPSLSGKVTPRSVIITLAALLPTRSRDRRYREVEVYFRPDLSSLSLRRSDSDRYAVRRGSIQHEVLTGQDAVAFVDGDTLRVTVSSRVVLKPEFADPVPYGLAITIEADGLSIYAEVEQRVAQLRARTQARQRV